MSWREAREGIQIGAQRQSSYRGMVLAGLLPGLGLASILIVYSLGNGAAHGGQGPPTSIKTQDDSPNTSSQAIPIWPSFHCESQVSLGWVRLTVKPD